MPGENLDLSSAAGADGAGGGRGGQRRFVGVHFACCEAYSRVYVNRDGTAYTGHCPRCTRRIEIRIGVEGTSARFFTAY